MADSFDMTKRELFELMYRMRRHRQDPLVLLGVTPVEAHIMMIIDELDDNGEGVRPGYIASVAHTTPSALSQIFKTLEEKGFIERHRSPGDFRAVSVSLTDEGAHFAAEGKRIWDEHMNRMIAYLGEEDAAHLVRILRKVAAFHDVEVSGDAPSCSHIYYKKKGDDAPCA